MDLQLCRLAFLKSLWPSLGEIKKILGACPHFPGRMIPPSFCQRGSHCHVAPTTTRPCCVAEKRCSSVVSLGNDDAAPPKAAARPSCHFPTATLNHKCSHARHVLAQ